MREDLPNKSWQIPHFSPGENLPTDLVQAQHEILRLRDEIVGLTKTIGVLRGELELSRITRSGNLFTSEFVDLEHVVFERDHYRQRAEELQHSTTWRVGSFMLAPLRVFRR